ncbi:MAG TPA: sulfite oxidase [Gemmatimonadales bacterium]|nr:sulfite oxidase [Gemmatimonadales bacterium]
MGELVKDARFRTLDAEGLNGGVAPQHLAGQFLTPPPMLFTRSHAAPPISDAAEWQVAITGLVGRPRTFSLAELAVEFPRREVVMTMLCAGLRRDEFLAEGPVAGELPWGGEPIGTNRWQGFSLRDILTWCQVDPAARHVGFTGGDLVEREGEQFGFGASIPLAKALDPDVLLATHLDGQPLPPSHGHPVRVVVPGWVGARSVKWLRQVEVRAAPSTNYFQTRAYRLQASPDPDDPRDVRGGRVIEEVILNAFITAPAPGTVTSAGTVLISGWAIGPDAAPPARVEVSTNGGTSWTEARLSAREERWTWRLWQIEVYLPPGEHELVVRAWDADGGGQPALVSETRNVKGYMNNAWHRLRVSVPS